MGRGEGRGGSVRQGRRPCPSPMCPESSRDWWPKDGGGALATDSPSCLAGWLSGTTGDTLAVGGVPRWTAQRRVPRVRAATHCLRRAHGKHSRDCTGGVAPCARRAHSPTSSHPSCDQVGCPPPCPYSERCGHGGDQGARQPCPPVGTVRVPAPLQPVPAHDARVSGCHSRGCMRVFLRRASLHLPKPKAWTTRRIEHARDSDSEAWSGCLVCR